MARHSIWFLAATAALAFASAAGPAAAAPPVGGCPSGGGFELFPTSMFPPDVVEIVDLNRDGLVCGKRTSSPFGGVIIDNAVRDAD
ncbi:hypothetical protein [Naasia sp. SYSU D00948]|uniref:hypothetical protein n=1 Tax=Naasia sp. SYSU D00948 TaxID=2817379 RepID=UPI001B30107F|nr:hypothetical protein [Naasia sp. SYSU D00948]